MGGAGSIHVLAGALTEIRCATMAAFRLRSCNIFHLNGLVTILARFDGIFACLVDESSTCTHAAMRSLTKSAGMKGVAVEVGLR